MYQNSYNIFILFSKSERDEGEERETETERETERENVALSESIAMEVTGAARRATTQGQKWLYIQTIASVSRKKK